MNNLTVTYHVNGREVTQPYTGPFDPFTLDSFRQQQVDSDHLWALAEEARMESAKRIREELVRSRMTVSALIDALARLPGDALVYCDDGEGDGFVRSVHACDVSGESVEISSEVRGNR